MNRNKPLRVGFDLDGVILYNPTRFARPIISTFKNIFLKPKASQFYIPKSTAEKQFWHLLHKSSTFIAPGYDQVKHLTQSNQIQAYLITARYEHLKNDFDIWCQKLQADQVFKKCIHNSKNQQPYLYKQRMIEKYKLDVFVEDNWDIVNHLHKNLQTKTKVLWITNLLDRHISYPYKFSNLRQAVGAIKKELDTV